MEPDLRKKRIIACGVLALMAVVFCFVLLIGKTERKDRRCAGVRIVVADSTARHFVSAEDVELYLAEQYGPVVGTPLDSLDLAVIERCLDQGTGILKSEVWMTPDGYVNASIRQRRPIMRLQTREGGYYCDESGYILPLRPSSALRVQTVDGGVPIRLEAGFSGYLPEGPDRDYLNRLLAAVQFINRSPRWSEAVAQIHIDETDGGLVLVLRDRPERFLFGQPEELEAKFTRLERYFSRVLPQLPEDAAYKTVNLQYKGQIICRNE